MNGSTKLAALLLLPLAAASVAAAANFPTGTHLVKGTLKDWQNRSEEHTSELQSP